MSDVIEGLRIVEDRTTKAGAPLTKVAQGSIEAGVNALASVVGMKLDGTLSYLAVNDFGQLIIETSPDTEAGLWMRGKIVDSPLGTSSVIAEISLLTSKLYRGISVSGSCSRFARFEVIHSDAGVDKPLLAFRTSGQSPNYDADLDAFEFISGSTGVQKLRLVGVVKEGIATDLDGTIITTEIQES